MELMQYQKQGVEWLVPRFRCVLADEMGLGKTIQVIGLIKECPGIKKVLIVCPASLKKNWQNEIKLWSGRDSHILGKWVENQDIYIINYDILLKFQEKIMQDWDLVVFDEAHYLKNASAARTKIALKIDGARIIFLTGTPVVNRPVELFNIFNKIGVFSDRKKYEKRYCAAYLQTMRFGGRVIKRWNNLGASNLEELQKKVSPFMLRRLKKNVLKELPDKTRQIIELDCGEIYTDKIQWLDGLPKETGNSTIRREAGLKKVKKVIDYVKDVMENEDKLVLMAYHKEVVEELAKGLTGYNPVVFTGGTSLSDRQKAVEKFQNDRDCRIFIGNILAAGVGITLTAARVICFAELDWVPGNMAQAEDRIHRIGQKDNVLVLYLVAQGIDRAIGQALADKIAVIEKIIA
jgi:SNF2 family DNA or RNA helicase